MNAVEACAPLVVAAALVASGSGAASSAQEPPEREIVTVRAENMSPRLEVGERVEFDLAAYDARAPAVGEIVLLLPPRATLQYDDPCGSPRPLPEGRLCVKPRGGPAPRSRWYIMRIVAVAGDRVRFRRGRVIRNGRLERRRIRRCSSDGCTSRGAITVPKGHVYVAGDNRGGSDDSRYWGALPEAQLLGRFVRSVGER